MTHFLQGVEAHEIQSAAVRIQVGGAPVLDPDAGEATLPRRRRRALRRTGAGAVDPSALLTSMRHVLNHRLCIECIACYPYNLYNQHD